LRRSHGAVAGFAADETPTGFSAQARFLHNDSQAQGRTLYTVVVVFGQHPHPRPTDVALSRARRLEDIVLTWKGRPEKLKPRIRP